jgi:hypothetical protein
VWYSQRSARTRCWSSDHACDGRARPCAGDRSRLLLGRYTILTVLALYTTDRACAAGDRRHRRAGDGTHHPRRHSTASWRSPSRPALSSALLWIGQHGANHPADSRAVGWLDLTYAFYGTPSASRSDRARPISCRTTAHSYRTSP